MDTVDITPSIDIKSMRNYCKQLILFDVLNYPINLFNRWPMYIFLYLSKQDITTFRCIKAFHVLADFMICNNIEPIILTKMHQIAQKNPRNVAIFHMDLLKLKTAHERAVRNATTTGFDYWNPEYWGQAYNILEKKVTYLNPERTPAGFGRRIRRTYDLCSYP